MSIDIYKDELQNVWLFGQSVLYTTQPIPRDEVPRGWYCYDLRGTSKNPNRPYELVDQTEKYFAGCILSNLPLKRRRSRGKLVPNLFWACAVPVTLEDHCVEENIPCPRPVYVHVPAAGLEMASMGWGITMELQASTKKQ